VQAVAIDFLSAGSPTPPGFYHARPSGQRRVSLPRHPATLGGAEAPAAEQICHSRGRRAAVYLYADPLVCRCVYFGTQQNWAAYWQAVFARHLADEAQMTAIMNQEA